MLCDKLHIKSRQRAFIPLQKSRAPCYNMHIHDRVFLQATDCKTGPFTKINDAWSIYFSIDGILNYKGYCDDFGPMDLGSVYDFFKLLESHLVKNPGFSIVLQTRLEVKALTNAVFLLGSYLIFKNAVQSPDDLLCLFQPVKHLLVSFRDVSPGEQNFHLYLRDCWAGLWRAKQLNWVKPGFHGFDAREYAHYGNPQNADLHEMVPGKFVAMQGPKCMTADQKWRDVTTGDGRFSHRELGPAHYVEILQQFDVQAVVRLNAPEYNQDVFTDAGLGFVDLFFEDCACPPPEVVAKFMMIAEALPGALAVHCKSGLGRTGTLIALYIMQHHNFTAREAIGWLRIVRPGSVIGPQQQYLVERENVMRRTGSRYRSDRPGLTVPCSGPAAVARLITEAVGIVDDRLRALRSNRRRRSFGLSSALDIEAPMRRLTSSSSEPDMGSYEEGSTDGSDGLQAPLQFCADLLPLPTAQEQNSSDA